MGFLRLNEWNVILHTRFTNDLQIKTANLKTKVFTFDMNIQKCVSGLQNQTGVFLNKDRILDDTLLEKGLYLLMGSEKENKSIK